MEAALTAAMPKCLKESLTCYIFVESPVVDSIPDIVTCNSNGHLYEVKNKKILRSLDINGAKGCSISYYHMYEIDKFVIFYLVLALKNKMFLVKRTDYDLQITNSYNDVKDVKVFDYRNVGYPQIKIYFNSSLEETIEFPIQRHSKNESLNCTDHKENTWNSKPSSELLMDKLQLVKAHLDELKEEKYQMEELCCLDSPISNRTCDVFVTSGRVKFLFDFSKHPELTIAVTATWHKMLGDECILGMKIKNYSEMTVSEMELLICNKKIPKYTFNFFSVFSEINEDSLRCQHSSLDIQPGDEVFVVGAFPIPAFLSEPNLTVAYYLTSATGEHFHKGILELDALKMATPQAAPFEYEFTIEDLMGVMTSKTETVVNVKTGGNDSVEWILVESLGFKKIKHLKDKFFYCTSTILREVFVFLKQVSINPTEWKMHLYTSNDSQIYLLVNALYDLLPENTTVLSYIE